MENKKLFDSKEEAEVFLDERRNEAKARIEERRDVILGIHPSLIRTSFGSMKMEFLNKPTKESGSLVSDYQPDK